MLLHSRKVQLMQELKSIDHAGRIEFIEWITEQVDARLSNKITFNDEAHFNLDDFGNRQNGRIWGLENLRVIVENQMHSQRVTVWCEF